MPVAAGFMSIAASLMVIPAQAAAVSFVSSKGVNTGNCASSANPCLTFQYALNQTLAGGEIKALSPGNYGPLNINKAITITGAEGAGVVRASAGDAITINAGANDSVNISRLTIDGLKSATNGIKLNSAGSLSIRNCAVQNFTGVGVYLRPTANLKFLLTDIISSNNGGDGFNITTNGGSAKGVLKQASAINNSGAGVMIQGYTRLMVVDSEANNNLVGFRSEIGAILRLTHSTATGNSGKGVYLFTAAESAGDNFIRGNGSGPVDDVSGSLTNVGTR